MIFKKTQHYVVCLVCYKVKKCNKINLWNVFIITDKVQLQQCIWNSLQGIICGYISCLFVWLGLWKGPPEWHQSFLVNTAFMAAWLTGITSLQLQIPALPNTTIVSLSLWWMTCWGMQLIYTKQLFQLALSNYSWTLATFSPSANMYIRSRTSAWNKQFVVCQWFVVNMANFIQFSVLSLSNFSPFKPIW